MQSNPLKAWGGGAAGSGWARAFLAEHCRKVISGRGQEEKGLGL